MFNLKINKTNNIGNNNNNYIRLKIITIEISKYSLFIKVSRYLLFILKSELFNRIIEYYLSLIWFYNYVLKIK